MRHLFYTIVEAIVEDRTGIVNGHIKLWELETYLQVTKQTTILANCVCAVLVLAVIFVIVSAVSAVYESLTEKN